MTNNIVELIQARLGFPALQKVDPNIQEARHNAERSTTARLAQAAIPAVLAAMLKMSRTETGAQSILSGSPSSDWTLGFFGKRKPEVVSKVAEYAGVSIPEAEATLEKVATEAVPVVTSKISQQKGKTLNQYLGSERHHILVYLPAALQLGYLIDDQVMDDRTNKMEGPMSNLMHKIENAMSKNDQRKYP